MADNTLTDLLSAIGQPARQSGDSPSAAPIAEVSEEQLESFLEELIGAARQAAAGEREKLHEGLLSAAIEQLRLRYRRREPAGQRDQRGERGQPLSSKRIEQIAELCRLATSGNVRQGLLRVLADHGSHEALAKFAELVATHAADAKQMDLAFAPLFQHPALPVDALFPALWQAIADVNVAVQVFDLANHVTRRGLVDQHPAAGRSEQLLELFSALVHRLLDLPQKPEHFGATPQEISEKVGRCLEHLVSLCDALALIGDQRAVGKLRQALKLTHRRLRTEAAAALARLGDKVGVATLVQVAKQPSVRRRALAYLEELGQLDQVPEELRGDVAVAEAELASWLAEPAQIGMPPHHLELHDRRTQPWPGYEEPVDCYLFRFEYHLPRGTFRSVGVVGPMVHALSADLTSLPAEDIYAIYAGWHAEHPEIEETNAADFAPDQQDEAEAVRRELEDIGYEDVQVAKLGRFFGQRISVSTARLTGEAGVVVTADDKMRWFPSGAEKPLGVEETYLLFKGRQLLSAFQGAAGARSEPSHPR